jgi:hypothetical protein
LREIFIGLEGKTSAMQLVLNQDEFQKFIGDSEYRLGTIDLLLKKAMEKMS